MEKKKVYVASPLGFNEAGRLYLRKELHPALESLGLAILDPWAWQAGLSNRQIMDMAGKGTPDDLAIELGAKNIAAVDMANLVVAVLDGPDVDSGTAGEMGNAQAKGLPVYALRTDFRFSGDSEQGINLQLLAYVKLSGGEFYRTLEDLIEGLKERLLHES